MDARTATLRIAEADLDTLLAEWRQGLAGAQLPLYQAIAQCLAQAIAQGRLRPGDRLPPQRQLATALGVDLTTVTRAFNLARQRGLLEARVGQGSFVRGPAEAAPAAPGPALLDMTMNAPPLLARPDLSAMLQQGLAQLLRQQDPRALTGYRVIAGTRAEREAGADWLAPQLGPRPAECLLVTPGAQSALLAVAATLLRPGQPIAAEALTYPGLRALARQLNLPVLDIAMDAQGMRPDALDQACRQHRPRLIYCTPSIQNPTTATMSLERRQAILAVARAHDALILEDEPYARLLPAVLPALAALDPARVFHVATLAKLLTPGLRTAYLVAPDAAWAERLSATLRATVLGGAGLLSGLATLWLRDGQAQALLDAIRIELQQRQRIARDCLGADFAADPQGPHLWLPLPPHWEAADFAAHAQRQGIALVPGAAFAAPGQAPRAVRIALGTAPDQDRLRGSLEALGRALQPETGGRYAAVV